MQQNLLRENMTPGQSMIDNFFGHDSFKSAIMSSLNETIRSTYLFICNFASNSLKNFVQ